MNYETLLLQTRNLSVLLVEDYAPLRNDMAEILEEFFKTVVIAVNGAEALELYENYYTTHNKYLDLVISDIQMPVMDGVEFSERLRDSHPEQPIIILSAHTDSDYLLRLINLGISKFLTKPIEHEALMDILYRESMKINTSSVTPQDLQVINLSENYIWDKNKSLLKKDNLLVSLTKHEILLLKLFIDKEEEICTNVMIMDIFYDHSVDISEHNIRNLVFKLRKKIPEKCISSIYGLGYKFISA